MVVKADFDGRKGAKYFRNTFCTFAINNKARRDAMKKPKTKDFLTDLNFH